MEHELWPAQEQHSQRKEVTREILVGASREEVWEALATEEGRERWLREERERDVHVEVAEEPSRLVWWWASEEGLPTRVEFRVSAVAGGTRVLVIERSPHFPLEMLAGTLALIAA